MRRTELAQVSKKRAAQLVEFRALRDDYLAKHPLCEFPDCQDRAVLVHHKRGRQGARLVDVAWFAASCWAHNEFAEVRTGEALALGWLVRIEGAA